MIKSLLVVWQNKQTLSYYHIGTLTFDGSMYTFLYTHHKDALRKIQDALRNGYYLHPAFPDMKKTYTSKRLFPTFDRRVPSEDREDYKRILLDLGLDDSADRMDLLKATRGKLSGDQYSFEQPIRLLDNRTLRSEFYINGMRHQDLPGKWHHIIKKGERLRLVPEPENDHDTQAIRIESAHGLHLGYVPAFYVEAIHSLSAHHAEPVLKVKDIRPLSSPQWWVQIDFSGELVNNHEGLLQKVDPTGIIIAA